MSTIDPDYAAYTPETNSPTGFPFIDKFLAGTTLRIFAALEKATPTEVLALMEGFKSILKEITDAVATAKAPSLTQSINIRCKEAAALFRLAREAQEMGYGTVARSYIECASAIFNIKT